MTNTKILICLDDSGQAPQTDTNGKNNSSLEMNQLPNSLKLHLILGGRLNNAQTNTQQKPFYYVCLEHEFLDTSQTLQLATLGFTDPQHLVDAIYRDVSEAYSPGDEILVLGFNRGTSMARMVASGLAEHGLAGERPPITFWGLWDTEVAQRFPFLKKGELPNANLLFETITSSSPYERQVVSSEASPPSSETTTYINTSVREEEVWLPQGQTSESNMQDGLSEAGLTFLIKTLKHQGFTVLSENEIDEVHLEEERVSYCPDKPKPPTFGPYVPQGEYREVCENIQVHLYANVLDQSRNYLPSSLDLTYLPRSEVNNMNGLLVLAGPTESGEGFVPEGSFKQTAKDIRVILSVKHLKADGSHEYLTLDITETRSNNIDIRNGRLRMVSALFG